MAALGNILACALVIFITLCVLIIFSNLNLLVQRSQEFSLFSESSAASVSRFEDRSWRSETGVTTCSKKLRSASNVVIVTMQSRIYPDNPQKVSGLGIYQSILNPTVLQICKIGYFSMIECSCTDSRAVYTVLKLEKWLVMFWNSKMFKSRLYCHLYPRKTNSNKVSRRIFKHRALSLRITHRTELYLSFVGKKYRSFVSALGIILVYALVIFIKLSVLIIFSNLTFLVQRSQQSSLFSESSASSVSRFENHSSRSETGVKWYGKKLRSFSRTTARNFPAWEYINLT